MHDSELRDRLLARAGPLDNDHGNVVVDVGELVTHLLLFDELILDSIRLTEIPQLVATLGYDAVMALLADGCLKPLCDARTVAQIGQTTALESRALVGALPLGSYAFALVDMADRDEYLAHCYRELDAAVDDQRRLDELKNAVAAVMVTPPDGLGRKAIDQLRHDLQQDHPEVHRALAIGVSEHLNRSIEPADISIRVHQLNDLDFSTDTNLDQLGIEPEAAHRLVERALLAVGGLDLRLEEMESYSAVSGYREGELPLFQDKVAFIARQLSPDAQEARFRRVISLAQLPDPGAMLAQGQRLDVERFLDVRKSLECIEFRAWLRTLDNQSDAEIADRVASLRARVAGVVGSTAGRIARFAVTTAVGLIPGAGLIAGPGLGALDEFVVDRLTGQPGPAAFVSHLYPSLFEGA